MFRKKYTIEGQEWNGKVIEPLPVYAKSRSKARDIFYKKYEYGKIKYIAKRKGEKWLLAFKWFFLALGILLLITSTILLIRIYLENSQNL